MQHKIPAVFMRGGTSPPPDASNSLPADSGSVPASTFRQATAQLPQRERSRLSSLYSFTPEVRKA